MLYMTEFASQLMLVTSYVAYMQLHTLYVSLQDTSYIAYVDCGGDIVSGLTQLHCFINSLERMETHPYI